MEKLEKLMQYIIGELVDNNSETRITYDVVDDTVIFKVSVAQGEMGKIIGKNGLTANAIRGVMQAAGVKDKDIVKLDIQSPNGRSLTFGDVVVRVSASYATAAHIDTDEANALCPGKECYGEMIK